MPSPRLHTNAKNIALCVAGMALGVAGTLIATHAHAKADQSVQDPGLPSLTDVNASWSYSDLLIASLLRKGETVAALDHLEKTSLPAGVYFFAKGPDLKDRKNYFLWRAKKHYSEFNIPATPELSEIFKTIPDEEPSCQGKKF